MSSLKERLTEIRNVLGSNAELARASGTSRGNVTQWLKPGPEKNDVQSLKAETALTLEKKTGYLARWIMYGSGPKRVNGTEVSGHTDEKKKDVSSDEAKLLELIRIFQETDQIGKDAIWAGAQRASQRIAKHSKSEKRSAPTHRR